MDDREACDRFMLLVEEYRLAGWIGLGKIKAPQGDDVRTDLALARHAIDTLGMLELKTRGNRTEQEERLLRQALTDLRINFADEVKRSAAESKPAERMPAESKPAEGTPAESTPAESTPAESKAEAPEGESSEAERPRPEDPRPADPSPAPEPKS